MPLHNNLLLHVPSVGFCLLLSCFSFPLAFQLMGVILYSCPSAPGVCLKGLAKRESCTGYCSMPDLYSETQLGDRPQPASSHSSRIQSWANEGEKLSAYCFQQT